ncbi:MAG: QueT transporter family protein [Clostridia bacterium]|nr:QueT transporter family protein [Clostridia bacterium]MBR6523977.1 QueT transporter family protein [Clostridia bacterium]
MKTKGSVRFMAHAAVIAALYVALTLVANAFGLSSGAVQLRLSEALTILPIFTPAAIPGLFIGCILANILTGSIFIDVIFGSLATLLGAIFTRILCKHKILCLLPPIISNTLIIPYVLAYAYHFEGSVFYFMLTVGLGEIVSCGVLGYLLGAALKKRMKNI